MTRSRTTWWRLLAIFAVFGLIAAACGDDGNDNDESSDTTATDSSEEAPEEDMAAPTYGGEIIMGLEAESNNWTPGPAQLANSGVIVAAAIYDPLMSLTAEGDFEPFLAESLEPNEDLTEWTMTLREGVMFADDTPLNADAIVWNYTTLHACADCQTKGTLDQAKLTGIEKVSSRAGALSESVPPAR
jgi:peptide/nickel transport system substrate-binding protein